MRRKGIITLAILLFMLFGLTAGVQAQEVRKIGFIDLSKTFDNYEKTKEYDAVLEKDHAAYEKDRNKKIDKLKEKQGKLALLKEGEKEKVAKEIEELKADLMSFDQGQKTELTKKRDEKIREILLEIEKVVSDFAKNEQYDVILNDRVLIFGSDNLDVTDQVLKVLNDTYNKK